MKNTRKIYVAMSGGVDSSVVAALLKDAGYDVTGVYMKNWSENFGLGDTCPWEKDVEDVKQVAEHLEIPWKVYNFEREYKARILDYFFEEYRAGRTPNPDIMCNNLIKFDLFAQRAFEEGASHIATGHYARRQSNEAFDWEIQGNLGLFTAIDANKDQVYFLQRLSLEQLEKAVFPLGSYLKPEVRILARHFNLPNAEKKDSQGICFVGDVDVRDFIRKNLQTQPGNIVDIDSGEIVGHHEGLWFYTPGQRQGIRVSSSGEPYYVVGKRVSSNELLVGKGREHELLVKNEIVIGDVHTYDSTLQQLSENNDVWAAIRYREKPIQTKLTINNSHLAANTATLIAKNESQFWAPAEGQGVILYENAESLSKPLDIKAIKNESQLLELQKNPEKRKERYVKVLGGGIITNT